MSGRVNGAAVGGKRRRRVQVKDQQEELDYQLPCADVSGLLVRVQERNELCEWGRSAAS